MTNEERLEKAVGELRTEEIPARLKAELHAFLGRPRGRRTRVVLAGATAALCAVAVLLLPSSKALAWQDVLASTLAHPKYHTVSYIRQSDGSMVKFGEEWTDGPKWATQFNMPARDGFPVIHSIIRYDGKRFFRSPLALGGPTTEGIVSDFKSKYPEVNRYSLDMVLNPQRPQVVSEPTRVDVNGRELMRYVATPKQPHLHQSVFYVDPVTKTVVRFEGLTADGKVGEYTDVQMVDSIPASQFEPPTSGMKVLDYDVEKRLLHQAMSHGIPFGHGNVLRALIGANTHSLTIEWTGTPPNADGSPHATVEGVKVKLAGSSFHFGLDPNGKKAYAPQFDGQDVYILNFGLDRPIGDEITLDLPVLVPDHTRPLRDKSGAIVAYRSKQIGTKHLAHIKVLGGEYAIGGL